MEDKKTKIYRTNPAVTLSLFEKGERAMAVLRMAMN